MISLKKHHIVIVISLVLVCSISLNAWAVNDIDALNAELDRQQQNQSYNSGTSLWLDFIKLLVVLGLIIVAAWSIIRIFSKQFTNKMQGTWIQVVDEVTLGPNRGIILCEVGEKLYAIGVADNNINLLFEVDNPKLLEEINYSQNDNVASPPNSINLNEVKNILINKLRPNQPSNSNRKDFHFLMDEQFQRLEKIASDREKNEIDFRRSDKDG